MLQRNVPLATVYDNMVAYDNTIIIAANVEPCQDVIQETQSVRPAEFTTVREDFEPYEGIVRSISNSKNFNAETENPADADALLIFSTAKQQAWLVATSDRLYGVVDDLRKEKPRINWSMSKRKLVSGETVSAKLISRDKNERSGLVDIGDGCTNWLYTKRLFVDDHIKNQVRSLIKRKMIGQTNSDHLRATAE